jgi:hypothetical protein
MIRRVHKDTVNYGIECPICHEKVTFKFEVSATFYYSNTDDDIPGSLTATAYADPVRHKCPGVVELPKVKEGAR